MKIKIKKINVVIENLDRFFDKSKKEFKKLEEGKLKKSIDVLSLSEDEYRNLFSKKRLDIIKALRHKKFISIYELAKQLDRPYKNVYDDINLLLELGIIEKTEDKKSETKPIDKEEKQDKTLVKEQKKEEPKKEDKKEDKK